MPERTRKELTTVIKAAEGQLLSALSAKAVDDVKSNICRLSLCIVAKTKLLNCANRQIAPVGSVVYVPPDLLTSVQVPLVFESIYSLVDVPANIAMLPSALRAAKDPKQVAGRALVKALKPGKGPYPSPRGTTFVMVREELPS